MLRVALVGIGDAGKHHARALATLAHERQVVFAAIVARNADRDAVFRTDLGLSADIATYPSLEALLAARACDAVVLATPDGQHAQQALACLQNDLHVLVEKPIALTSTDAEPIVAMARARNRMLMVGYHLRHHVGHALLRRDLTTLVGAPRTIHVRWAWPDPAVQGWRARGENARFWSLAALGTHGIDLALWLGDRGESADTSKTPNTIAGVLWPPGEIDRAAEISFTIGDDILAHVSVSVCHRALSRVVVTGTLGEVEALGTLGARGDGELFHRAPRLAPRLLPFASESPYLQQMRAFVIATATGFADDAAVLENVRLLDRLATPQDPRP